MLSQGIDHIAVNVPNLDAQIERLTTDAGLVVEHRFGDFALISDPSTGLKLELGRSEDGEVQLRHFGFRADDVDRAHQQLVKAGMETTEEPHRRDFAAMYTSFLHQEGCVDVQLVKYDPPAAPVISAGLSSHEALASDAHGDRHAE
jgi:catechol 2,3-dioxygenase-like lactoylglutathione lyase family enzyme